MKYKFKCDCGESKTVDIPVSEISNAEIICDKCNKEANFFGAKELNKEEIDKLSIEYNTEFKAKLMKLLGGIKK